MNIVIIIQTQINIIAIKRNVKSIKSNKELSNMISIQLNRRSLSRNSIEINKETRVGKGVYLDSNNRCYMQCREIVRYSRKSRQIVLIRRIRWCNRNSINIYIKILFSRRIVVEVIGKTVYHSKTSLLRKSIINIVLSKAEGRVHRSH